MSVTSGQPTPKTPSQESPSAISKVLASLVFLTAIFPYVTPFPTSFDTQPYCVVVAAIFCAHIFAEKANLRFRVSGVFCVIGLVGLISVVRFFGDVQYPGALRSLVGYLTIFLVALAAYKGYRLIDARLFIGGVTIWFTVAVIQAFVAREFGQALLPRMSTSLDRGVTSLAVEPSYLAICCIFFLVLNDIFFSQGSYGHKVHRFVFAVSTAQILLAASSLGIVLFLVYLIAILFTRRRLVESIRWLMIGIGLLSLGLLAFLTVPGLTSDRTIRLFEQLQSSPETLLLGDASTADRLVDVLLGPYGLIESGGFGYGLDSWSAMGESVLSEASPFIQQLSLVNPGPLSDRLMSGWGAAIFELGLVGLLLPAGFLVVVVRGIISSRKLKVQSPIAAAGITTFVLMTVAVPLAFPLFGYMFGVLIALVERDARAHAIGFCTKSRRPAL